MRFHHDDYYLFRKLPQLGKTKLRLFFTLYRGKVRGEAYIILASFFEQFSWMAFQFFFFFSKTIHFHHLKPLPRSLSEFPCSLIVSLSCHRLFERFLKAFQSSLIFRLSHRFLFNTNAYSANVWKSHILGLRFILFVV